jgi:hypothetical protein
MFLRLCVLSTGRGYYGGEVSTSPKDNTAISQPRIGSTSKHDINGLGRTLNFIILKALESRLNAR